MFHPNPKLGHLRSGQRGARGRVWVGVKHLLNLLYILSIVDMIFPDGTRGDINARLDQTARARLPEAAGRDARLLLRPAARLAPGAVRPPSPHRAAGRRTGDEPAAGRRTGPPARRSCSWAWTT